MRYSILMLVVVGLLFSVDYNSEIQPIFNSSCISCHSGPNAEEDLNLISYNNVMNGGESGDVVIPYDHVNSLLWQYVNSSYMPPYGSGSFPLTTDQINLIAQWIDEGALPVESSDISGCSDSNAITCDDEIDTLYFPECITCSDDDPCDNYYNPNATIDNGLCMYNEVPGYDEFIINVENIGLALDWSAFTPSVALNQYVLMRCLDADGDTDGDGDLEYENCYFILNPSVNYQETYFLDEFDSQFPYNLDETAGIKYTLSLYYPNNNYWGSAFGNYYYDFDTTCENGEISYDDPCNLMQCVDGVWLPYMVIDCEEQMGMPCEGGVYIPPAEGVCCSECVLTGDLNFDGIINVIDIVTMVNGILSNDFSPNVLLVADFNGDGIINVIDIVSLVNNIIS